eukprot:NODE_21877_length_732_cov_4.677686.p1 GENE.NODE_21877_length_732_cov_4.677686~~NODE_21877_length_732_cov_4.677686.p1  ORF type:complete len:188 (+),score=24.43 NODE_21877_length_732_cov_4.677686:61-624(+)
MLPLHRALEKRASDTVIEMLLKACPGAANEKGKGGKLPLHIALKSRASDTVIEMLFKEQSDFTNISMNDIASLVFSVSPGYASHGKLPRLFPVVSAGATTLGAFEYLTQAVMVRFGRDPYLLEKSLNIVRVWHHGGMLWKICIERTVGHVLPKLASRTISEFVCGECACELCCRPRPAAEATPGGDK